jgi:hypothetical protein
MVANRIPNEPVDLAGDHRIATIHLDALVSAPLDGVAVAGDDRNLYAALRRRPNETVTALLQWLDDAIGLARHKGVRTKRNR